MSIFTENLIISPLPDGRTWVSRKAFSYDVGEEGSGETIKVPAGFITDFASVPRLFWAFFPTWGKYGNAAVIHDYLYWEQSYPRERADEIFLEGMLVLGVEKGRAKLLYNAVKHFGKRAWARNKKAKERGVKKFIDIGDEMIEIPEMELKGFVRK
ncbi:MAG: DUF1353 domain-containing protein [Planctomycetota bacterium]|jgi:hypothetical protein